MKNQTLSISQMRHLQELGVDTSKASMFYVPKLEPKNEYCLLNVKPNPVIPFIPAFTLQDIIELLPESIMDNKNEMYKGTKYWYYLTITPSWVISYDESKGFLEPIKLFISESLLDAAYKMLCWCAENGYLKEGNE